MPAPDWCSLSPAPEAATRPEAALSPELRLLRAILLQACKDAHASRPGLRQAARKWLQSAACAEMCACLELPYTRLQAWLARDLGPVRSWERE